MIKIILSSFLVTALYTPFGVYFHKGNSLSSFSLQLIFGLIIISFFALFFNFFFPLNPLINSILLTFSLVIIFKYKKIYLTKNFIIFCSSSALIIFLLVANSNMYRPDAGLYHLPYINLLNEEKIILGVSNLNFRFGHISILQYLSAFTNNFVFGINGIVFAGALVASSIIINFLSYIYIGIKNQKYDFHFLFIFSILIFIFYKMNRFSEYGNDAPAHFLMFLLISEIIKNFKNINIKDIPNYFLISIFIIMNKVILIASILFPLVFFTKKKIKFNPFNIKILFIFFFLASWLLKNVLVSGCVLYPLKATCLDNLKWSNIEKTEHVSSVSEAWAKGWSDFRKKNAKVTLSEYSSNFFWLKSWGKNHFLIILKILIPYILFLAFVMLILKKGKINFKLNNYIKLLLLISFIGILMWFYKAPIFRYGYSFIIIFVSLVFALIGSGSILKKNKDFIFKYLIIICLIIFSGKNLNRVLFENKNYFNYPWPKFYSYTDQNKIIKNKYKTVNKEIIYTPVDGYCMYSKAPCGYIDENLNIEIKNDYLIMFINTKKF